MDIKKYEVLLKIIEKGSFSAAASELGYTTSGISQMMSAMEEECGINLLQRSNRGVRLTEQGKILYPFIQKSVRTQEQLKEKFDEVKNYNVGKLRIAGFSSTTCSLILPIVKIYREQHPNITIEILEENSPQIMSDWLRTGIIDVAVTTRSPYFEGEWVALGKHPYVAVFSKTSPLAKQTAVTAEQLRHNKILMYQSMHGYDFAAGKYLTQEHVDVISNFTSNSNYIMLHMIEETDSICLVTKMLWDFNRISHPNLVAKPLIPELSTDIILAVNSFSDASLATQSFIQYMKKNGKDFLV